MKHDKVKLYLFLALIAIVSAMILLLVIDINVPIERERKRLTQEPIRATPAVLPTDVAAPSLTILTPTHLPTRVNDATAIPTPILVLPFPGYWP